MWNQNALERIKKVHSGQEGSHTEQNLLRNYLTFYACDTDYDHYDIGYDMVMKFFEGKKRNPFIWIGYSKPLTREYETIYSKEM